MKCGLICARSARTSASISRVRDGVELGQLELAGHPLRDLVGGADQAGGGVSGEDLEGADDPVVDDQRADHRGADRAAGRVRQDSSSRSATRVAPPLDGRRRPARRPGRRGGEPRRPRPAALGVGERDGRGAEQLRAGA